MPDALARLQESLKQNSSLAALMTVPLLALMVCDVFSISSHSPPTTKSQLYSKLLVLVVQRAVLNETEGRLHIAPSETDSLLAVEEVQQLKGKAKTLLPRGRPSGLRRPQG